MKRSNQAQKQKMMPQLILPTVLLVFLVATLTCTSKESEIKKAALAGAKVELQQDLEAEISKAVSGKPHLQTKAVKVLTENALFEVKDFDNKDEDATVLVVARTEPQEVKEALIDIMSKLEARKQEQFNVPDAIHLIRQRMGLPENAFSERNYQIKVHHGRHWEAIHEPKK
jgi:hypothetical protein